MSHATPYRAHMVWHENLNGHSIDATHLVSRGRWHQRIEAKCAKCGSTATAEANDRTRPATDGIWPAAFGGTCPGA